MNQSVQPESDTIPAPALVRVDRAAGELRRGQPVVVCEGDGPALLALAAETATEDAVANLKHWCQTAPDVVLTHTRAANLKIRLYTPEVVAVPFTSWMTAELVRSLADPTLDLSHPLRGPFEARRDPLPGPAAATIRLAKIARLLPAVIVAPVPPGAGGARGFARRRELIAVDAQDLHAYDAIAASTLEPIADARVPLAGAEQAHVMAFRPRDGSIEHLAIVIGDPRRPGPVLMRIHSECFTGDLLASLRCDCGDQLRGAIRQIAEAGGGIVLYLAQEGRGIGLVNKLRAYRLQDQGFDTMEANERLGFEADERLFEPAAEMLRRLGFTSVRLLTNNPHKVEAMERLGIRVTERVPHAFPANSHNEFYLSTKATKGGHFL
jgi:GTP cyclohydrolase II